VDHLIGIVHREDQHLSARCRAQNAPGGFQAVQFRHRDVEHDDVRLQRLRLLHRLTAGGGFSADFPAWLRLQQCP
jgi:hypothetical protein